MKFNWNDLLLIIIFVALTIAFLIAFTSMADASEPDFKKIVVHHTATGEHVKRFGKKECDVVHSMRGFDECGYNYLIQRSGVVEGARGLGRCGAHASGHNCDGIGIAFVMDGRFEEPTQAALNAFKSLVNQLEIGIGKFLPIFGHGDVGHTLCPTDSIRNAISRMGLT